MNRELRRFKSSGRNNSQRKGKWRFGYNGNSDRKGNSSTNDVERMLDNMKKGFSGIEFKEKAKGLLFYLVEISDSDRVEAFLNYWSRGEMEFYINATNVNGETVLKMALRRSREQETLREVNREREKMDRAEKGETQVEDVQEDIIDESKKEEARRRVRHNKEKTVEVLYNRWASINEVDKESEAKLEEVKNSDHNLSLRNEDASDKKLEDLMLSDVENSDDKSSLRSNIEKSYDELSLQDKDALLEDLMLSNIEAQGSFEVMKEIRKLIKSGASMNKKDCFEISVLMHAIMAKDGEFVKELLNKVKDEFPEVYSKDVFGKGVFSYIAEFGNKEILSYFVDDKKLIDVDMMKEVLFMEAVRAKNVGIVECIVDYVGCKEDSDDEVMDVLSKKDDEKRTVLMFMAQSGNRLICESLIKRGLSVHDEDIYGCTALIYAVRENNLDIVEFLLKNGAKIDHKTRTGVTSLMFAALSSNEEIGKYLVQERANIHIRDNKGRTALMCAAEAGNESMLRCLVDNGAYINNKDNKGRTALMYAAKSGDKNAVKYLISRGADMELKDKEGRSASDYAGEEIRKYIRDKLAAKARLIRNMEKVFETGLKKSAKDKLEVKI